MDIRYSSCWAVLVVCVFAAPALAESPPSGSAHNASAAQPSLPMQITTDSVDYCGRLAKRVEDYQDMPDEVRTLVVEGRRMCDAGHVIGGVMRLRRAVTIMRGDSDTP